MVCKLCPTRNHCWDKGNCEGCAYAKAFENLNAKNKRLKAKNNALETENKELKEKLDTILHPNFRKELQMKDEKQIEELAEDILQEFTNCYSEADKEMLVEMIGNASYHKSEAFSQPHENGGEWISVEDRLPEINKLVLCLWTRANNDCHYGFATYQHHGVWYVSNEGMPTVTHWMPLPEPPKMGGE